MNEVIEIKQAEMLNAINRAEVDVQIATAKQYPRDLSRVLNQIETYATMDTETAEDCFYALRRGRAEGGNGIIEGVSVRLAEIIAGAWGNLRVQTRIIGNDGRTITAQGICHDLETNVAVSTEVKRRITTKDGRTFSDDMQVVTGNAAASIAFRNAVLKVVPKAVTKKVINNIKMVALGQSIDLETTRQRMLEYYMKIGVTKEQLFDYLEISKIEEIDKDKVFELRSLANAIKEGTTTVQECFKSDASMTSKKLAESVQKQAIEKINKAKAATQKATEKVDTESGEIIKESTDKQSDEDGKNNQA